MREDDKSCDIQRCGDSIHAVDNLQITRQRGLEDLREPQPLLPQGLPSGREALHGLPPVVLEQGDDRADDGVDAAAPDDLEVELEAAGPREEADGARHGAEEGPADVALDVGRRDQRLQDRLEGARRVPPAQGAAERRERVRGLLGRRAEEGRAALREEREAAVRPAGVLVAGAPPGTASTICAGVTEADDARGPPPVRHEHVAAPHQHVGAACQ
mmetsp:Transcript_12319/g.34882  ORF Transcript_12319/g.34882 Transcript_12319/m.34882 type:complete len:215 (+) Transcript_12319:327-971(+)